MICLIFHQLNLWVLLISRKEKLVAIKHFRLNFFFGGGGLKMCDKIAISAYILKIVEKDPFLRLQLRAKEMFNCLVIHLG